MLAPGVESTRGFMSLAAGAGARCMGLRSSCTSIKAPKAEMKEREDEDPWKHMVVTAVENLSSRHGPL